jgi:hypothetical protein
MARYTFELREVISTFGEDEVKSWFMDYDLSEFLTPEEIKVIEDKGVWSKEQLADRIITHFKMREIGTDSIGSFKLYLKDLLNETMETYAPIIYSTSIKFDPLVNVDFTETFDRTSENQSQSNSTSTNASSGLTVNSDTPMGQIDKSEILKGKYASSTGANETENNINDESASHGTGSESYTKRTKGNSGVSATAQALIKQYRDVIRAVNTEIVYQLEPLFMGIY